jgi:hypothetical protein
MAASKSTPKNPQRELQMAQLEKHKLENAKLKQELQGQGKPKPWHVVLIQFVPIISALVAVAGFLWGVYQYQAQQTRNLAAQKLQSERELETAQRDLMRPWLDSQREIYLQALTAASTVANASDPEELKRAKTEFWNLYHGRMILVETQEVADGMIRFGNCINSGCNSSKLNEQLHQLATAMANSMAATAQMTYAEFSANQFQYISKTRVNP